VPDTLLALHRQANWNDYFANPQTCQAMLHIKRRCTSTRAAVLELASMGGSGQSGDGADKRWYEGEAAPPSGWFSPRRTPRAARDPHGGTYAEPSREVPVHLETDVLVVGGGPSGCAAATAAARLGADVTLVERYGHLGGLATGGLVFWIDRMTDWEGRQVITGYADDVLGRLPEEAVYGPAPELWGSTDPEQVVFWRPRQKAFRGTVTWSPTVDPEWLKMVSVDLLEEAGAGIVLHSWAVDAIVEDGAVRGIVFESKQGRRAILARVVVDATGDLDVCALAGARYESDTDAGDVSHCLNVVWCFAGIDLARWLTYARESPDEYREILRRGAEELGHLELPAAGWRNDVCVFMGPRLSGFDGLDVDDLTAVEIESRRRMADHLRFYREHAPGFESAWIMTTASQTGIRHTRRLTGVRKLASEDWKAGVRFDDEIGVSPSPSQKFETVSVPYGSLLPVELDGILASGRHIACDPSTQSFMREIPQCWVTGQAAGVAAALAVASDQAPREVDVDRLRAELRRQNVFLHVEAASEAARAS